MSHGNLAGRWAVVGWGVAMAACAPAGGSGLQAQVEGAWRAGEVCLQRVRGDYPEAWSIERVLEQRALADGWRRTPTCPRAVAALEALAEAGGAAQEILRRVELRVRALTGEPGGIDAAAQMYRRMEAALIAVSLESHTPPRALRIDGTPPPPAPPAAALPRWPQPAADYRTLAWPLADGVLLLEIARHQPGQPGCPAGAGAHCHGYGATWVSWDGKVGARRLLALPEPTVVWWRWEATPEGYLVALGNRGEAPALGLYPPQGNRPVMLTLPPKLQGARRLEARTPGVVLVAGESAWLLRVAATPTLVAVTPAASGTPLPRAQAQLGADGKESLRLTLGAAPPLLLEKRGRLLLARRAGGSVRRLAELYTELGHLNYVASEAERLVLVFTHPSTRATSLLLSPDAGANWLAELEPPRAIPP